MSAPARCRYRGVHKRRSKIVGGDSARELNDRIKESFPSSFQQTAALALWLRRGHGDRPETQKNFVGSAGLGRARMPPKAPCRNGWPWVATGDRGFRERNAAPPRTRRRQDKLVACRRVVRKRRASGVAPETRCPISQTARAEENGRCTGLPPFQASPIKRKPLLVSTPRRTVIGCSAAPHSDLRACGTLSPRTRPDAAGCEPEPFGLAPSAAIDTTHNQPGHHRGGALVRPAGRGGTELRWKRLGTGG